MSGWIKFEKDLATDPRVLRMARELGKTWFFASVSVCNDGIINACNADPLPGVTLVLGALTRLWIYADSHARDDDSLDLGTKEIDELIGISGFCSAMPDDWLREIDENTVELPGFQAHNGVEAKKKALTQKRVSRHRDNKKHNSVISGNASTLPDQDQTKTRPDQKKGGEKTEVVLHESLPKESWEEWLIHRREKRMPMDSRTLRMQLNLLAKHPTETQREMIEQAIISGWQGLFAPRVNGKAAAKPANPYASAI